MILNYPFYGIWIGSWPLYLRSYKSIHMKSSKLEILSENELGYIAKCSCCEDVQALIGNHLSQLKKEDIILG